MNSKFADDIESALCALGALGLSKDTVKYYRSCFKSIRIYCDANGIVEYTDEAAAKFIGYQKKRYQNSEINLVYSLALRKAAVVLIEYQTKGEIHWERKNYKLNLLPGFFETTLIEYRSSLLNQLAIGSVNLLGQSARQILSFLVSKGHSDCRNVSFDELREYLVMAATTHQGHMGNVVWAVKRLFNFLNNSEKCSLHVEQMLHSPAPTRKKVLPCFTENETKSLLTVVDTDTACGKRDFAFMTLAVNTGFRGSDIANMKLSDIDWQADEINIIQQKTQTYITLPLLPDAGNALADYILNARPKTDVEYVFLRVRRPFQKLGKIAGANIIERYLKKAGVYHAAGDGKSFHAFRRTVGTRMIESGAGLALTSQFLGHTSINSSKRYIALNDNALRECCMDISAYATTKEGLR